MGWGLTHSIVTIQITQFACIRIVFNWRLNQDNVSYFFLLLECLLFLEKYTGMICCRMRHKLLCLSHSERLSIRDMTCHSNRNAKGLISRLAIFNNGLQYKSFNFHALIGGRKSSMAADCSFHETTCQ